MRLAQGRFDAITDYGDPFAQLMRFERAGATWAHVVDLDGARLGRPFQTALIARLAEKTSLNVQCGGGVRTRADVEALFDAGAARVVIGSAAVRDPCAARAWIDAFGPDRICVALDLRMRDGDFAVAADGWAADGGRSLEAALVEFPAGSLRHLLVTDISRDGTLTGPNIGLMKMVCDRRPDLELQASGGVSTLSDLATLKAAGAGAAIVGRALYEERFSLEAALAL